jgi:hypothetical protein
MVRVTSFLLFSEATLFANTSVYFLISGWIAAVCCLGISAVLKKGKTKSVSKEEEE